VKKIAESIKQKIEKLNQELILVKEERNRLNLEAKKWAEKRDRFHEKIRTLRTKAANAKETRDALNVQVQELKTLRDKGKVSRKEMRDKISELKEKLIGLTENKRQGNLRHIEREIEEIDWKIQTTSLPVKEEERLINQIRQLEAQLSTQKQMKKVKENLQKLQNKKKDFEIEEKTLHEKLSELAEQSQKFHKKMLEVVDKAHNLQAEADKTHQNYIETRTQAQKQHQKYVALQEKIRALERMLKEQADKRQSKRKSELQKELEERALAKLKRGEKLLWEEYKILAQKGKV
jgi:uncharacterized coiled-coil DUF342 family protein